ncbi:MAG: phosphoribosylaminoimidazolecarboxamide formyltransferase [Planctomycetes bacterium]|nr:phosphoribosylaminoimidazolecarboxamide formyltransferase [Planctomycetota bacterium]
MARDEITLRYGCNPHQDVARLFAESGKLPITVRNGAPGYINMMDALNAWQLVRELKQALGLPAAASFKHVSPAGAAVGVALGDALQKAYFVEGMELSPLAEAYARARGADRMSSFGDFVAVSDVLDAPTARILRKEISDGVIAPAYEDEALEILQKKRGGKYLCLEIDPAYEPPEMESKDIFGLTLEQKRNDLVITESLLDNVVTKNRNLPDEAKRDLIVATIALKYAQSNSVCFAMDGQVIGMGAGQQSRVHCTRLAASKADIWWLRQHPDVLAYQFKKGLARPNRDNAVENSLLDDLNPAQQTAWEAAFDVVPTRLTVEQKKEWMAKLDGVSLSSDAFFPFRDSIDRAHESGVKYIVEPGGSLRDDEVIAAADEYGMVMAFSGIRLFHH